MTRSRMNIIAKGKEMYVLPYATTVWTISYSTRTGSRPVINTTKPPLFVFNFLITINNPAKTLFTPVILFAMMYIDMLLFGRIIIVSVQGVTPWDGEREAPNSEIAKVSVTGTWVCIAFKLEFTAVTVTLNVYNTLGYKIKACACKYDTGIAPRL